MNYLRAILFIIIWGPAQSLHAQIPELIRYQGRLVDGGGLVNSNSAMVFKLFNIDTGGSALFQETQTVQVVDGLYSVSIGASNATPNALSSALTNPAVYLEVMVNASTLSPRERITAASYALISRSVSTGAITTAMLANNSVTSNKIVDGTIGTLDLANNSVTGLKILDGTVGTADFAANSVTMDKFANHEDFYIDPDGTIHAKGVSFHDAPNSMTVQLAINNITQTVFLVDEISEESDVTIGGKGPVSGSRRYREFTVQRRLDTNTVWRTWMQNTLNAPGDERDIKLIVQQPGKGGTAIVINIFDAFPSQLEFVPLRYTSGSKGGGGDITTVYYERMTIEHHNWVEP